MKPKNSETVCHNELGICGLDPKHSIQPKQQKPLEIYTFIDPFCPECWAFEPILKKLQVEYGAYFRIRSIVAGRLQSWNVCRETKRGTARKGELAVLWDRIANESGMSCDGDFWLENEWSSPYKASLAIKAAELQGPKAGTRFLRKMREHFFLEKQNITEEAVLFRCAETAGLDIDEFRRDLVSSGAEKALQCDLKTLSEMDVDVVPTFVFFQ